MIFSFGADTRKFSAGLASMMKETGLLTADVKAATARIQDWLNSFDAKKAVKSIDAIRGSAARVASASLGPFSSMAVSISAIGSAARTVTGAFEGLARTFIAPAASMERVHQAFEVMMGDAGLAQDYVGQLQKYAATTPFKFDEITAAAKTLMTMGVASDKSIIVLKQLGDVAAASGKPLTDLAAVYAKAANIGLTNEVAEQFELQGVAVRRLIAEMRGITTPEVFQGISKRQYGIGDVDAVLRNMTGSGGQFEGMTEKQGATFAGLWSTLGDNGSLAMAKVGEGLTEALKPAMAEAIELMQEFLPVAQKVGEEMATALRPVARTVLDIGKGFIQNSGMITSLIGVVSKLTAAFATHKRTAVVMFTTLTLMGKGFGRDWSASMIGVGSAWKAMCLGMTVAWKGFLTAAKSALASTGVGLAVVALGEAVGYVYNKIAAAKDKAAEVAEEPISDGERRVREEATAEGMERTVDARQTRKELEKRLKSTTDLEELQDIRHELENKRDEIAQSMNYRLSDEVHADHVAELERYDQLIVDIFRGNYDEAVKQRAYERTATEAAAERARAEKEAAKNRKDFAKKQIAWEQKEYEARLKGMDVDQRQEELVRSARSFGITVPEGFGADGAMLDSLYGAVSGAMKQAGERGDSMASIEALEKLRERVRTLQDARKQEERITEEHERRVALLRAEIAGDEQKIAAIVRQQEKEELISKFRKGGMSDGAAEQAAEQEVYYKRVAQRKMTEQEHEKRMELLRAEAQGDEKKAASIRQQQEIAALTERFRKGGMTQEEARAAAVSEVELTVVRKEREKSWSESMQRTDSVPRLIAQSGVSVGNGGASINLGRETVNYAKQQVNWLGKIHETAARLELLLSQKQNIAVLAD